MKKIFLLILIALSMLSVSVFASTGYCGNGLLDRGETCEMPGTQDNTYCLESATNCLGRRLGERSIYGDCSALCKCSYDKFTYSCVKGACGAQCSSKEDCTESTEKCMGNKLAKRAQYGICHYNCNCQEYPFSPPSCVIGKCDAACAQDCDCPQTTEKCSGTKTATRPEFGKCSTADCQCSETSFSNYKCIAGSCDAECGNNTDCSQSETTCVDKKLGTRSNYGQCMKDCTCKESSFNFKCVKDECGASCSVDSDCNDGDPGTTDKCALDCSCTHIPVAYCGDGVLNYGEQCELPGTFNNEYCDATTACNGRRYAERPYGNCNAMCKCAYDIFAYKCVVGECGAQCATPEDCPETSEKCFDTKLATRSPVGECHFNCNCQEYPFSTPKCVKDSCHAQCAVDTDCSQSTEVCSGHKVGTRADYGKCLSNCQCRETTATNFKCVIGACDAQCTADSDCAANEKCSGCMCVCKNNDC